MVRSQITFEVKVKEGRGKFSPVIDSFKGDARQVVFFLKDKYVSKKSVFRWFAEPFNVLDDWLRED